MSEKQTPGIRKWPASRGLAWVTGSVVLIRTQVLRLLLISLFFQFFLSFSQAGALGLLVILCLPVLSAGLLHALYLVEQGQKPMLAVLFMPFTVGSSLSRLLLLGAVVLVLGLIAVSLMLAGQLVDIDPSILSRIEEGDLEALQMIDPQLIEHAVMAMAVGAAISGTISYFSVPLIWFNKMPLGQALGTGLIALARNWKPLLLVGMFLTLLAIPVGLLFAFFYVSVLTGGTASFWLAFLMLLVGPIFQLMLFATQYMAFRDIFGIEISSEGKNGQDRDQLVA